MESYREDGLVRQFEPACHKYAARLNIPGLEYEDAVQELRIAALYGIRSYREGKGAKLATFVLNSIKRKVRDIRMVYAEKQRFCGREGVVLIDINSPPISDKRYDRTTLTLADLIPADDITDEEAEGNLFLLACRKVAESRGQIPLDILNDLANPPPYGSRRGLHERHGITRSAISLRRRRLLKHLASDPEVRRYMPSQSS